MKSKDQVAKELIEWHFQIEPGLSVIFRVISENENDPKEPIKLIELNEATIATDQFEAYRFAPTEDVPYPTLIAEVTPQEFDRLKARPGAIPSSWNLVTAERYLRQAA